ncbi:PucR family transcriptional regulator [Geodermatophilus ruber]|uniref:PucR C-terminal helix-turn-helix domain-containing protein n=1 Tax=Geodermatophilus ruber TaxID=504800 RepID=A0A1I4I5V1_9ACTN|nr:helix-turn-helix domain-containing protein [Geodermatophilus ruber]SFL49779.1 PucR C-terminal helix-turn-helix domain-containing protein [Geodermatophilus ruber]
MLDAADPALTAPGRPPLPGWVREMAADVDLVALCERVVARDIAVAFPGLAQDDGFAGHLRASVRENLRLLQQVLCGRLPLAAVRLEQPLAFARVQAELHIPQTALQRSYRVGFVEMWRAWADRLQEVAEASDVPRAEAVRALADLTAAILDYQDHVASLVAENHARVDEALSRTRAHVRQGLVREILRGDRSSLAPSDLITLDHDLGGEHVVVLLPAVAEGAAGNLMTGLRARTGVRQTLVHPLDLSRTAVWLTVPSWTGGMHRRLLAALADAGMEASVSEPLRGLAGFREAHEQARDVERVRAAWGRAAAPRVLGHADVALEILLLRDPARARRFVRAELGPLAEDTPEAGRLRETLEASFRLGSHVGTAEHLGLHEHTVRNRLHRAEEHLGHPLPERRTELQVALRLQRLLAGAG